MIPPSEEGALPVTRAADIEESDRAHAWLIHELWARSAVGIIGGAP